MSTCAAPRSNKLESSCSGHERKSASRGVAAPIYQPLRQGKRGHRQRLRHSAVISAAEPHDNQIIIVQAGQLTGRRDTSHRLLASPLCVSRLQAENYLAADLRAEPGYPTGLSQYL